jgi:hypothetical protein
MPVSWKQLLFSSSIPIGSRIEKAASVLQLNSYWFKDLESRASVVIKEFQKDANIYNKRFPKVTGFDNILKISSQSV